MQMMAACRPAFDLETMFLTVWIEMDMTIVTQRFEMFKIPNIHAIDYLTHASYPPQRQQPKPSSTRFFAWENNLDLPFGVPNISLKMCQNSPSLRVKLNWHPHNEGVGTSFRFTFTFILPATHILAPENEWLESDPFLLGPGLFSGAFAVSFREGAFQNKPKTPRDEVV